MSTAKSTTEARPNPKLSAETIALLKALDQRRKEASIALDTAWATIAALHGWSVNEMEFDNETFEVRRKQPEPIAPEGEP